MPHHRVLSLTVLFAATVALAAPAPGGEAPERSSLFTGVRWNWETPLVQFEGQWYGFESIDGIARARIIARRTWTQRIKPADMKVPAGYKTKQPRACRAWREAP